MALLALPSNPPMLLSWFSHVATLVGDDDESASGNDASASHRRIYDIRPPHDSLSPFLGYTVYVTNH